MDLAERDLEVLGDLDAAGPASPCVAPMQIDGDGERNSIARAGVVSVADFW